MVLTLVRHTSIVGLKVPFGAWARILLDREGFSPDEAGSSAVALLSHVAHCFLEVAVYRQVLSALQFS